MRIGIVNNPTLKQEDKRLQIATLLNAGHGTADIVKQLQFYWHTVYVAKKRLKNGQDLKDRPCSEKPRKLTLEVMKKAFSATREMKMTAFAKKKTLCTSPQCPGPSRLPEEDQEAPR